MSKATIVFTNFLLIDGTGASALPHAFLRVAGDRIVEMGPVSDLGESRQTDAEYVDLSGFTVVPGLIDAHQHLTFRRYHGTYQEVLARWSEGRRLLHAAAHCLSLLREGITTVRDCGGTGLTVLLLRKAVDDGVLLGPSIVSCGQSLAMTGGHGWQNSIEVDGPDEARRAAREMLAAGADFVKCKASGGFVSRDQDLPDSLQLGVEEMAAAFEEAHRAGKRTTVHAHAPHAIQAALEAGVDCIEHAGLLDDETAEMMAARGTFLVPTLSSGQITAEKGAQMGRPKWLVQVSQEKSWQRLETFRKAVRAGVQIVAGVDSIGEIIREMELLMEGGLSSMDSLMSATSRAALCLGVADQVGTVEPGKIADLVVVRGNPLDNVRNLEKVELVVKGGVLHRPLDLASAIAPRVGA